MPWAHVSEQSQAPQDAVSLKEETPAGVPRIPGSHPLCAPVLPLPPESNLLHLKLFIELS